MIVSVAAFWKAIPRVDLSTASLTTNFVSMAAAGLPQQCLFLVITNNSSNVIEISYDGVTAHDTILGASKTFLPIGAFLNDSENNKVWKRTQQIWVKSATSTAGTLSIAGYYC